MSSDSHGGTPGISAQASRRRHYHVSALGGGVLGLAAETFRVFKVNTRDDGHMTASNARYDDPVSRSDAFQPSCMDGDAGEAVE
jgi:hypothetical protein